MRSGFPTLMDRASPNHAPALSPSWVPSPQEWLCPREEGSPMSGVSMAMLRLGLHHGHSGALKIL